MTNSAKIIEGLEMNYKYSNVDEDNTLVCTEYGITEGWYNPDRGCWYTLVMFLIGRKTRDDIDMERGDIPAITNSISVTHWMPLPEPPKGGSYNDCYKRNGNAKKL